MENETKCCDICYDDDKKILLKICCCKGKKWCNICKLEVLKVNNPKCPFCRSLLYSSQKINNIKTPANSRANSRANSLTSSPIITATSIINGRNIYSFLLIPIDYQPYRIIF
jgi:hypothetical protein